jgi:N-acetylglucosaminyldiphosphoundecaprenol N-acetyl-beta-D-mannosaminyltransferase
VNTISDIISNGDKRVVDILGLPVSRVTLEELLQIVDERIKSRERLLLGVVNVAKVVNARRDSHLRRSLNQADLILADGLPVVWLSRILGNSLPERIAGIDIMYELLQQANENHYRVYFLGTKPEILLKVIKTVQRDYPGIRIAGYRDGYFDKTQEQRVAEGIRNSRADVIFVAIGSPKKENFLCKWRNFINVPVCHGVGGSFDILAGVTKRAPRWMQKCGLEWLYRLIQEPRRMWKRYLVTNTIFIILSFEAILRVSVKRYFHRFWFTFASNDKKPE